MCVVTSILSDLALACSFSISIIAYYCLHICIDYYCRIVASIRRIVFFSTFVSYFVHCCGHDY